MLKKFLYLIAISINLVHIQPDLSSKHEYNHSDFVHNFSMFPALWTQTNLHIVSIMISLKDKENSARKIKAKLLNKLQHSLYGNRNTKKMKNHIKITQLNKGKSNFPTFKEHIKNELIDACADIAILGESNFLRNEPNLHIDYPEYVFENKFHPESNKSRITVMLKRNITYTRLYELETSESSAIWLKVKVSPRKYVYILCVYRQWHTLPELDPNKNSGLLINQIKRFDELMKPIQKLAEDGQSILVAGDINIDQLLTNDPDSRYDIRKLNEVLTKYKDLAQLQQLNFKATRHQQGCRPSLLDLYLSNTPTKIDSITTKHRIISDH